METTLDGLLGRRVALEQPAQGYRVAVDTVLLAAAVHARAGQAVLDLGCGAGGAMLCLAARVPGIAITGIEIQDELLKLCQANIVRNNFENLQAVKGDATRLPDKFSGAFDRVMANPPYHDEAREDISADKQKRTANAAQRDDLAGWLQSAAQALKPGGSFTLIYRADRLDEIQKLLPETFGTVEILPLLPREAQPPKRVILRAQKGGTRGVRQCRPLVLHGPQGSYSDEVEGVLRHLKTVEFAA